MTGPFDDPREELTADAALAADYALGALDGEALSAAELQVQRDPEFARAVSEWRELLMPLNEQVVAVIPAVATWTRIEQAINPATAKAVSRAPAHSLWTSLGLWRALTAAATTVAAVAVAMLVSRPAVVPLAPATAQRPGLARAATPGTLLTAAMSATGKPAVLLNATFDPVRGAVILTPASADRSRGKTLEMWLIIGKDAPRSLGVIDLHGPLAHRIPNNLRPLMREGATLAISLEPAGGSPTGAPTGPVIMTGKLTAV